MSKFLWLVIKQIRFCEGFAKADRNEHGMPDVALTDEFWTACSSNRLVRPVCNDCGTNFFTPQWCCPQCQSESWEYVTSNGIGTVYSYTVVHRAPTDDLATPYVLAIITMDEGWHIMTRLLSTDTSINFIGRRAEVAFTRDSRNENRQLPTFQLRSN